MTGGGGQWEAVENRKDTTEANITQYLNTIKIQRVLCGYGIEFSVILVVLMYYDCPSLFVQ